MAVLTVEETKRVSRRGASEVTAQATPQERDWLSELRSEIDTYFDELRGYATTDPAEVMASISSIHARLTHIRVQLQRSGSQRANSVRTKEVDPLIEALEFQFKCHSRMIALAEQEWRIAGGAN